MRPVVKAWSATSAGSDAIISDRSASRIALRSQSAPNWQAWGPADAETILTANVDWQFRL